MLNLDLRAVILEVGHFFEVVASEVHLDRYWVHPAVNVSCSGKLLGWMLAAPSGQSCLLRQFNSVDTGCAQRSVFAVPEGYLGGYSVHPPISASPS